ncbi:hypothetical protein ACFXTO_015714 [Malus domestica]
MLGHGENTPYRFELLSMVKKHLSLLGKTMIVADEDNTSDVELDHRFWHDVLDLYFVGVTTRKVFLRTLYAVAICSHQDLRNHQAEQVGLKKGSRDNTYLSRATTWSSASGDLLYLGLFDNPDLGLFLLKLAQDTIGSCTRMGLGRCSLREREGLEMALRLNIENRMRVRRYELVRTLGDGNFTKTHHEGDGAIAKRAIGSRELRDLDHFLMLDHFSVSPPTGFPNHPYRLSHTCYREALLLKTPRVTRMLKLANPMPL